MGTLKSIIFDGGYGWGKCNGTELVAVGESTSSDRNNTFRDTNKRQIFAAAESIIPDTGDALREVKRTKAGIVTESSVLNRDNGFWDDDSG